MIVSKKKAVDGLNANAHERTMATSADLLAICTTCDAPEPTEGNYFVSAYPPFSCWKHDQTAEIRRVLNIPRKVDGEVPLGLYLHVPFCAERCHYCYYRSYARPTREQTDRYIEAVLIELSHYGKLPAIAGRPLDFAYFGGGTPSLLSADQIERLLEGVTSIFPFTDAREVTFECAPQTITVDRLAVLRNAGVTRISLGVQQLDDAVLCKSGRIHRVDKVERAIARIEPFGFPSLNLDLMVGLVGETNESFFASLERVIEMRPMSVTIYLLEIPVNTPLFNAMQEKRLDEQPAPWAVKRSRLARAFERLEQHGYTVSSAYAAVRDPEKGRFIYQQAQYHGADLMGVGVASFSYFDGVHFQNQSSLEPYMHRLSERKLPHARAYALSAEERMIREFVLQLKLGSVRMRDFMAKFDVAIEQRFATALTELTARGWLKLDQERVSLTRDGLLRIDRLIPAFYLPQHRGHSYW